MIQIRPMIMLLAAIAFSLAAVTTGQAASRPQPNIIIFLADDLGYGELGCQGNKQIPTPHIDSIAANGIRCTAAYVTAPNCSPSRAGLLTGRIPTRFGYEFNPIGARNEDPGTGLPAPEITLAEWLHDRGYTTGLIGKWHLGAAADFHPHRHGFDEFFGFAHEGHFFVPPPWRGVTTMLRRRTLPGEKKGRWQSGNLIYTTHMGHDEPRYDANNPIVRGGQPVEELAYLTDAFTREGLDFIQRHQDKPFFLFLSYNAVHSPLQAQHRYMEQFTEIPDVHRRIFAGMLANLDDSVGSVLRQLRRLGLEKDTLIFFLSDNGGPTRELTSSNAPLRGEKGRMYEGGLRVPFLVQWKGVLPENQVHHQPVWSPDIFATAAAVAGGAIPNHLDGINLLPLFTDESSPPERPFFWRQGHKRALRQGDWKLVNQTPHDAPESWELYHLPDDLAEKENIATAHPDKTSELISIWTSLNNQMTKPLF